MRSALTMAPVSFVCVFQGHRLACRSHVHAPAVLADLPTRRAVFDSPDEADGSAAVGDGEVGRAEVCGAGDEVGVDATGDTVHGRADVTVVGAAVLAVLRVLVTVAAVEPADAVRAAERIRARGRAGDRGIAAGRTK